MSGSLRVVTLDTHDRNFSLFRRCSLGEATKCVTINPGRAQCGVCLRFEDRKGVLRPRADADLVVLDLSGNVFVTW